MQDLEHLIQFILEKDRQVLRELLTTDHYFVDIEYDQDEVAFQPSYFQPSNGNNPVRSEPEYATVYGLPRDWVWTNQQPVKMPSGQRAGILTHPAWLAAWSGNFDNHPVQRGKWIRTHLLGGTIPDVPICVEAKVPENESQQFRERLVAATRKSDCWRCRKKMDPLGLPREQFTHYGHLQRTEVGRPVDLGGDHVCRWKHRNRASESVEMMRRLEILSMSSKCSCATFGCMGPNETLGDAATLKQAHAAYRDNDGS